MARYKDIEPIIDFIEKGLNNPDKAKAFGYDAIEILTEIEYAPTADVVEVRHGKWIPIIIQDNYLDPPYCDTLKCSKCEQEVDVSFGDAKYCFNCGARMDGDAE